MNIIRADKKEKRIWEKTKEKETQMFSHLKS